MSVARSTLKTAALIAIFAAACAFVVVSVGEAASVAQPQLRTAIAPQNTGPAAPQVSADPDPRRNVRVVYPGLVESR